MCRLILQRTLVGLLAAGVWVQISTGPALAVESASCTAPSEPHAGRPFTLGAVTAPLTGNYSYRWDLDNDGIFETDTGAQGTVQTEKPAAGTYTIGVTVTDTDVPAEGAKREARGTCSVTVVNAPPTTFFEVRPVAESFPVAYEATRFTYSGYDEEDDLNERLLRHAIDFDGDGQFEYTAEGDGEVFASFPAGFDQYVTHRVTDAAGATVDKKLRITVKRNAFGIGGTTVIAPVGLGALGKVTPSAPKSIKRRTLLKRGFVAAFLWGPSWGHAEVVPAVRLGRTVKKSSFSYEAEGGYAPGHRLTINRLHPDLAALIRRGAKQIQLRWTAKGQTGPTRGGTLVVRITGREEAGR